MLHAPRYVSHKNRYVQIFEDLDFLKKSLAVKLELQKFAFM